MVIFMNKQMYFLVVSPTTAAANPATVPDVKQGRTRPEGIPNRFAAFQHACEACLLLSMIR